MWGLDRGLGMRVRVWHGQMTTPFLAFKPLPWQERFLRSRKKSPWAIGANRSGKTECGAWKMASRLIGYCPITGQEYPDGGKYWAIAVDFPSSLVVREKIEKYLGVEGRDWTFSETQRCFTYKHTGSRCWLKSCDSGRKKLQGQDLDGAWFDEEPPFEVFKEVWTRCIDRAGQVWGTMTPIEGSAWLYQRVYATDDPDFDIITMAMTDNKYIPPEEIERAKKLYRDEDEIAIRVGGEFRLMLGRPVLHIPSLQQIQKLHIRQPSYRGYLRRAS